MIPCRLLIDQPARGAWNMSVDEALLLAAGESGTACLRFYRWSPATLSLGYFQRCAQREEHRESIDCDLVRRASGGGAIIHDRELTYSLVMPRGAIPGSKTTQLYTLVHQSLIDVLATQHAGSSTSLCVFAQQGDATGAPQPFLCFQRRSLGDVLLRGEKIAGSAQRRSQGAVLQHGSVLLDASPRAPQLPGWQQLTGLPLSFDELAKLWVGRLAETLRFDIQRSELTAQEQDLARSIQSAKYANRTWTYRR